MDVGKVREYYDKKALECLLDCRSTINDPNERRLEIIAILKYIKNDDQILDVGCGNGFTAVEIARRRRVNYCGIDFSASMIDIAEKQKEYVKNLKGEVKFEIASVVKLPYGDNVFDKVISERCLINLSSWEDQQKGILEINRVLRPKGLFLMLESFSEGLVAVNSFRRKFHLAEIPIKWFNLYFEESKLTEFVKPYFEIVKKEYFNSSYYLATRVFYPALLKVLNKEPFFESRINRMLSFLPNLGRFGYIRLYVFKKI